MGKTIGLLHISWGCGRGFRAQSVFPRQTRSGGSDSSRRWGSRIPWRAYLREQFPVGDEEVRLQGRASKFQTKHDVNGDRFLCAVVCMGLRGIQWAVTAFVLQLI